MIGRLSHRGGASFIMTSSSTMAVVADSLVGVAGLAIPMGALRIETFENSTDANKFVS